jgi:hypothetical protein
MAADAAEAEDGDAGVMKALQGLTAEEHGGSLESGVHAFSSFSSFAQVYHKRGVPCALFVSCSNGKCPHFVL